METGIFDELLGLEDRFYNEGFQLGTEDGAKAGRIQGRALGLEKGLEKYIEIGRLHGKSLVWASRLPKIRTPDMETSNITTNGQDEPTALSCNIVSSSSFDLPTLPANSRLEKHIKILYALTEPVSLSTDNSEDAVSDFDDRLKRSMGKVKVIEKLVGEEGLASGFGSGANGYLSSQQNAGNGWDGNIEDVSLLKARH